jgi:hypothetical protein
MSNFEPRSHGRRDGGFNVPVCGQTGLTVLTTEDPDEVTCGRCRALMGNAVRKEQGNPLSVVPSTVSREDELAAQQAHAVRTEQNYTRAEVLAFLVEGDLDAAIYRMQRGFDRQVRLAGLEREIRESREKEEA